ncbi:MAG: thiamine biosynthesis protein ThiF [Pseudopedobacter saltans]|uniref:Thiamine biosynthesis protein ThiF n=1 Tax=Pseudopedobacter saltans TaxID=151895 RepID=A0A2W5EGP5_9SPHI|nr:MAG: thiamine biosynthesis protein ThiF [Pseudopedobacter saltans]
MVDFKKEEFQRYLRQMILDGFHREGQVKLKETSILVIGAGGIGCPALQYLTAAGIGKIGIVDFDKVELTNLHRQILYDEQDIGEWKSEVAVRKLQLQNPHVQLEYFTEKMGASNAATTIEKYDIVLDGTDNFHTRYLINDICAHLRKPLAYGTILDYKGQVAFFNIDGGKNLRSLFPEPPNPKDVPDCNDNGVLGTVPGLIGIYLSQMVIRYILGDCFWKNKLLLIDSLTMQNDILEY